jgi:predicted RNA binding protein YcfA (HicA-like mRNA interferase family)
VTGLPTPSSAEVERALKRAGFKPAPRRGKGSHRAYVRQVASERTRLVIVPVRKSIPRGTLASIIEMSGLTREEFLGLL